EVRLRLQWHGLDHHQYPDAWGDRLVRHRTGPWTGTLDHDHCLRGHFGRPYQPCGHRRNASDQAHRASSGAAVYRGPTRWRNPGWTAAAGRVSASGLAGGPTGHTDAGAWRLLRYRGPG